MKKTWKFLFILLIGSILILLVHNYSINKTNSEKTFININNNEWTSYQQLINRLTEIEENSDGRVSLNVIGESHQGRDIYAARVGQGDKILLVNSEIHGNEKSGTDALLQMLDKFVSMNDSVYQNIHEKITIVAVLMLNPDGAELIQRSNTLTWDDVVQSNPKLKDADSPSYYNLKEKGFDINRDFNPDFKYKLTSKDLPGTGSDPGFFLTNEAQALRDLYITLQEEFGFVDSYVDIHHMGKQTIEGTDIDVTIALDYPPLGPDDNLKYIKDWPEYDPDKSRRYALAAASGISEKYKKEGIVQYTHNKVRDKPGQARSVFALHGSGTVLFEIPGKEPEYGYNQEQIDLVEKGLWGIAEHMANNSIDELNGDDFYQLPKYWSDSPNPSKPMQFKTDFTEYKSNETPSEWTHWWLGSSDEWKVVENPIRLQHNSGSGRRGLTIDAIGDVYGDVEVFAIVRGSNIFNTLFQIGIHRSGYAGNENSIVVDARVNNAKSSANSLRILEWRGGKTSVLAKTKLPFEISEDEWYRVLLQRSGESLRAKMWPEDNKEPSWQLITSNTAIYGGEVGISHFTPGTINDFAFISVGVGGKSAPHAPKDIIK